MESDGVRLVIRARVKPSAKRDYLCWIEEGNEVFLQIEVKSPPMKGKANQSLLKLIRKKLNRRAILLKGQTSGDKVLEIENMTLEEMKTLIPQE
ncbi:MAG: DUF167 domain-containing protein [Candidatus Odinarchaeota archaeon]